MSRVVTDQGDAEAQHNLGNVGKDPDQLMTNELWLHSYSLLRLQKLAGCNV